MVEILLDKEIILEYPVSLDSVQPTIPIDNIIKAIEETDLVILVLIII